MRRIAVIFPGDARDPGEWSGIPAGLLAGIRDAGAEPVAVNAALPRALERGVGAAAGLRYLSGADGPRRLRRAYRAGLITPALGRLRGRRLRVELRRHGSLDGVIQLGTGYRVHSDAPVVTYEDMTVRQALEYPYEHWSTLGAGAIDGRIELQSDCYRSAAAVCMTNSWAAASVREDYGVEDERVHVVGIGCQHPRRSVARDWSHPRFLFVGIEFERKNGPAVLRAFARLRERHPGARLDVVGGHPELAAPGVVGHGLLSRSDPEERTRLRGLFDAATCFVMPSHFEPSAIAYTEAAACGLPSIGTRVGGSADIIGDGGTVIDPEDDDAILGAMLALADPARAATVGVRAARRAEAFTWPAVAARLLGVLEQAPAPATAPAAARTPARRLSAAWVALAADVPDASLLAACPF